PKPSSTSNTDLFLIHENSGFWKGNGEVIDNEGGNWESIKKVDGNNGTIGTNPPDYVVLTGNAVGANVSTSQHAPEPNEVNWLETLSFSGVLDAGNHLEGVINAGMKGNFYFGRPDGEPGPTTGKDHVTDIRGTYSYELDIFTTVTDVDGSEWL